MKIEVTKEFDCVKVGHQTNLPTDIANDLIEKGFAKEVKSKPETKELKTKPNTK